MALTGAQKQARYREKHIQEGDQKRLQTVISFPAKRVLERLARHHKLTIGGMLEKLIMEERNRITAELDDDQCRAFVGE